MKGITVVTRESHKQKYTLAEVKGDIEVVPRVVRTVEKDGKLFEYKRCTNIVVCKQIVPIRHSFGGEDIYSCAYDNHKWKFCPKTEEIY